MEVDQNKFPHGITHLAQYVHAKGLKLALQVSAGATNCDGKPGSKGHTMQDAIDYAAWGVDFVHFDDCNVSADEYLSEFSLMKNALESIDPKYGKQPVMQMAVARS